jgi:prepilin-type N-terminal cleavage/methylation domain-containing protein
MSCPIPNCRTAARAGFTLIEILAVIAIIGILAAFLIPQIPAFINRGKVTACEANMRNIYAALQIHHSKYNELPRASGSKFIASIIARKVWEGTAANSKRLTCPAVERSALTSVADLPEAEWYTDLDRVDGNSTAYAGRDMEHHPLRKFPGSGKEILVADDNDPEMNHDTETVVLYADNSVGRYDLVTLEEQGLIEQDANHLLVGPASPVEELRTLTLD